MNTYCYLREKNTLKVCMCVCGGGGGGGGLVEKLLPWKAGYNVTPICATKKLATG